MRARLFQKVTFHRLPRPKLTHFVYNFKSFPMLHCISTYREGLRGFVPPNEHFSVLSKKNNWKVTFKLIVILTCIDRAKCYILVQELCGCDSNSAFTTLPSAAGTQLFMFLAKKNEKKRPIQNFVGDLFPHRGKCCGFVQEFRYWGQNSLCSRSCSVTSNKRGIRLMINGTV